MRASRPRLVIFDVDGTLVDSQDHIHAAMSAAFGAEGLMAPPRPEVLSIVGLSLPEAVARLAPDLAGTGSWPPTRRVSPPCAARRERRFTLARGQHFWPCWRGGMWHWGLPRASRGGGWSIFLPRMILRACS